MPLTTTTRGANGPRRRRVLAGGAAALLAGGADALLSACSSASTGGPDAAERSPGAARLRERAARDTTALLERYDATLAAHTALTARLRPLRAEVARHAEAFGTPGDGSPSASAPASASPSAAASATASPAVPASRVEVPEDEKAALAALADAERRTADNRTATLGSAPPELARLLASVAAAGAAHAFLLTEGGS
ncbi:hypothetical protein [Streptomyces sp. UNOB3_S3]|uniref:hypothetical protein n=1 Tax=Streptomyces sp. UNOB3_S3 TaxID=2871682 RepID=UPI001E648F28|nr:hypothetical protein [Streptomyces sp. UNOB3_S3]MCC3777094.1 hypothetical protein [Streptomyces sp. UNOB3_S3]